MAAEPMETITVTGSATVFVKPDAARINYVVRATDASADAAKDTAAKQLTTIADSVKGLKLDNLKTTNGTMTFSRATPSRVRAAFNGPGGPGLAGPGAAGLGSYTAQIPLTTTITEKDPSKLIHSADAFMAKIVEGGATIAGDADPDSPFTSSSRAIAALGLGEALRIEWLISDEASHRHEALRAAVRKAKGDAEALAKELGWEKITILSIVDTPYEPITASAAAAANAKAPAGEVPVTARVTIKCSR
jgi:uncharacterized protein YggE